MADVLKIPPLVASEGELAVVYRTATYLWGAWNMNLPDGVEAEEFEYGRAMGYVGDLDDDPDVEDLGARRWVRADVTTDAVAKHSDVPAAFDAAEKRTAGDVFFETDIGPSGLGRMVPNVDFRVGDVVPVLVSSKVIESPVNEVRYESSPEGLVALAHVGGQLTGQPAGLEAWNSSILATINQERENQRREREAAVAAARAEAKAAAEREELERKKFESYVKTDFKYDVNSYALNAAESKSDAARKAAEAYADAALNRKPWKAQVDDALAAAQRAQSRATEANSYAYRLNNDRKAQIQSLQDDVQRELWKWQAAIDDAQNDATAANTKASQANSKAIRVQAEVTDQIQRQWTRFWAFGNSMTSGWIGGRKFVDFGVEGGNFRITAAPGYPMDYGVMCHVEAISNHSVYYSGSLSGGETRVHSSDALQAIRRGLLIMQPRW